MVSNVKAPRQEREDLPLSKAAQYLLEECRMVLPGIQTLFGFQLIVVFNQGFTQKLNIAEQRLHLVAMALLGVAIALIMTPAAYHRQTDPTEVTAKFIRLASRLLLSSMAPLAMGICIDFYLVGHVISGSIIVAFLASTLLVVFVTLWFLLPRFRSADSTQRRPFASEIVRRRSAARALAVQQHAKTLENTK